MRPLEDQLGCFGYHGFGGGYAMAKWGTSDDDRGVYCNRCPRSAACWDLHRRHVRALLPEMTALVDELSRGRSAKDWTEEFCRQTGQSPEKFFEPYSSVMMGNMSDGASVALTGRPQARGDSTLAWPLVPRS